jgi:hypothetical protein
VEEAGGSWWRWRQLKVEEAGGSWWRWRKLVVAGGGGESWWSWRKLGLNLVILEDSDGGTKLVVEEAGVEAGDCGRYR